MWSDVTQYRMDAGVCEVVTTSSACFDRVMISAGCAGLPECDHGGDAAPWFRDEQDTGASIANVDVCGDGIAGWNPCEHTEDGIQPSICACACE